MGKPHKNKPKELTDGYWNWERNGNDELMVKLYEPRQAGTPSSPGCGSLPRKCRKQYQGLPPDQQRQKASSPSQFKGTLFSSIKASSRKKPAPLENISFSGEDLYNAIEESRSTGKPASLTPTKGS